MEALGEPASGGEATDTEAFQDEAEIRGYPVNSSCPSTTQALSIPHIRERIVNYVISADMSSFGKVRAVGRAWQETAFDVIKKHDIDDIDPDHPCWLPLGTERDYWYFEKAMKFLENVSPDAWLPILLEFELTLLEVPLATRFAQDYSHNIVGLHLVIDNERWNPANQDKNLEVFQGRDLCRLQSVKLEVYHYNQAPVEEIQKGLDAIEGLTGSLTSLMKFDVNLDCELAEEDELLLPSRITQLCVFRPLKVLFHARNTLPWLRVLKFSRYDTHQVPQEKLRIFLEHRSNLEKLSIFGTPPELNMAPLPLLLPQLESLKEITLEGLNYDVETTSGSDVLPNLTKAELHIELNLDVRELARLSMLGRLLRNATRFSLGVSTGLTASLIMEPLSESISNVTNLEWTSESGWEALVLPISHVFRCMTSLQVISLLSERVNDPPMDLCRLLTGLQESEIREVEKATILSERRDILTNLSRLRSLKVLTGNQFQPLSPFLFQVVLNSMPELTEIELRHRSRQEGDLLNNVQEMVTAWRASGKLITTGH